MSETPETSVMPETPVMPETSKIDKIRNSIKMKKQLITDKTVSTHCECSSLQMCDRCGCAAILYDLDIVLLHIYNDIEKKCDFTDFVEKKLESIDQSDFRNSLQYIIALCTLFNPLIELWSKFCRESRATNVDAGPFRDICDDGLPVFYLYTETKCDQFMYVYTNQFEYLCNKYIESFKKHNIKYNRDKWHTSIFDVSNIDDIFMSITNIENEDEQIDYFKIIDTICELCKITIHFMEEQTGTKTSITLELPQCFSVNILYTFASNYKLLKPNTIMHLFRLGEEDEICKQTQIGNIEDKTLFCLHSST